MNWHLATDEQLLSITNSDKDCPTHLLSGVVNEMLHRGLFDNLIYWIFKRLTKVDSLAKQSWNMDTDDILSLGYVGITNALNRWKGSKSSFKTFAYMNIRSEFTHHLDSENAVKREINKLTFSYDTPMDNGDPFYIMIPDRQMNVEKEVIRNIEYENKMQQLSVEKRKIIELFLEGYKFSEINKILYRYKKNGNYVRELFYESLRQIDINHFVLDESKAKAKKDQRRLTPEIVKEIREAKRQFRTKQEEADYYGISRKLIRNIREYKAWKEVV